MNVAYSDYFEKRLSKLPLKIKRRLAERVVLFMSDSRAALLRDHSLTGNMAGFRAFSVTGDVRVIYEVLGSDDVKFVDVGTHNQVYR